MLKINNLMANSFNLPFRISTLLSTENEDRNKFGLEYKPAIIGLPNFTLALIES